MIIDSHAHYSHARFENEVSYLAYIDGEYRIFREKREAHIERLKQNGIVGVIEPSIEFDRIGKQKDLAAEHGGYIHTAIGVHPTRCFDLRKKDMKKLAVFAEGDSVIAIGETGLDYHFPRKEQHRLKQKAWFIHQIKLADRLGLPLILHVRDADANTLKILKRYRKRLHGGVMHCFHGDFDTASEYIDLGFSLGIGGYLLTEGESGKALRDTVARTPLDLLLVETDSPHVLPNVSDIPCTKSQKKKLCNSSLILSAVIREIAKLKNIDAAEAENAIYENTLRVFWDKK